MKKALFFVTCLAVMMFSAAIAQNTSPSKDILIGEWSIQIGNYSDTWTFKDRGVITSANEPKLKGNWKKEKNCVLIQWDQVEDGCKTWEAFTLPLKEEGTRGGNWNGQKVLAKKSK